MGRTNKRNTFHIIWSATIGLSLLLVLFSLLFASLTEGSGVEITTPAPDESGVVMASSAATQAVTETDTESSAATSEPSNVSSAFLTETEDAGQEYIDRLTFLGDSTTHGLEYYGVLSDGENTTQVWTPSSGTLTLYLWNAATIVYPETNEEITIAEAVSTKKPEYLVITLGVNGVSTLDESQFKLYYGDLIDCVLENSSTTRIICNSIYPVESDYQYIDQISNEKIDAANTWIEAVAEEKGCKYTDSASVLKGDDGALLESYGNGDGIHLNADGYNAVLGYLRTHAYL